MEHYTPDVGRVLDYGSGKVPRQTELLRQAGFDVHPYEVHENRVEGVHVGDGDVYINCSWDVILLSNVLNVQDDVTDAAQNVVWALGRKPRVVIFNMPNSPCYWARWGDKQIGPAGRRHLLEDKLMAVLRSKDYNLMQKYPYSGGVVYVIDNGQAPKEPPKFLSTRFGY